MKLRFLALGVGVLVAIAAGSVYLALPKEVHIHADFAVFIGNEQVNFSNPEYISDQSHTLSERTHIHDEEGRVLHIHVSGVTFEEFLGTLGIFMNYTCLKIDNKTYCKDDTNDLRMFVNSKEISDFENYEIKDLDRILLVYDSRNNIEEQLKSVSDIACVFSNKCPEKGQAAGEDCVSGSDEKGCS